MLSSWKFLLTLYNKSVCAITNIFLNSNDMNKRELTKNISNKTGISIKRTNYVIQSLLEIIKTSIEDGESVSLQNFGTFKLYQRKARNFYNIATRNIDVLPKQKIVRFVPHKKFKGIYSVGNILTNAGTTHTLNCSAQIIKELCLFCNLHSHDTHRGYTTPTWQGREIGQSFSARPACQLQSSVLPSVRRIATQMPRECGRTFHWWSC